MAGYVTQSRVAPYPYLPYYGSGAWITMSNYPGELLTRNPTSDHINRPNQVTTSYRSGRQGPEADEYFPATDSHIQFVRELRDESRKMARTSNWDTGHTFTSTCDAYSTDTQVFDLRNKGYRYRGNIIPDTLYQYLWNGSRQYPGSSTFPDVNFYGARAIASTIPSSPNANLTEFLGELLTEAAPRMVGLTLLGAGGSVAKKLGGEFLNLEFGWKPFVRDLQEILRAVRQGNALVRQYVRDSGRQVRRRMAFPEERKVLQSAQTRGNISLPINLSELYSALFPLGRVGSFLETITQQRRVWFSGAYTYHLPSDDELLGRLERYEQEAQYLLGIELTPDVVWNLAPWSWLSDWCANVGVVLSNANALSSDGQVIRYAYLMAETTTVRDVTVSGVKLFDGSTLPPVHSRFTSVRKERFRSTPYGFGLNPASFTGRQKAILAAIGLTR